MKVRRIRNEKPPTNTEDRSLSKTNPYKMFNIEQFPGASGIKVEANVKNCQKTGINERGDRIIRIVVSRTSGNWRMNRRVW